MTGLLDAILGGPVEVLFAPARWPPGLPEEPPFARAARVAVRVDRLGYAFAAGYTAALVALGGGDDVSSLCVTEAGGNSPKAIETRLDPDGAGYRLTGEKVWSTGAGAAQTLLVLASTGEEGGRKRLRLVRVAANAPGVTRTPMPTAPFVPEIPHYSESFAGVAVGPEAVLPGDGWERYVKPFRTVEDIHVLGATLAWLVGVGRRNQWPQALLARLACLFSSLGALAVCASTSPAVHVALGGVLAELGALLGEVEIAWATCSSEERAMWERDRPILAVASRARALRLEAAWRALAGAPTPNSAG